MAKYARKIPPQETIFVLRYIFCRKAQNGNFSQGYDPHFFKFKIISGAGGGGRARWGPLDTPMKNSTAGEIFWMLGLVHCKKYVFEIALV